MEQQQSPKYATLFYHIRLELGISWVEYLMLDMVYHLQAKTGYCYKTPALMAKDLGITKRGANKMIARLISLGLLERLTDHTLRTTSAYASVQYVGGNKVPTRRLSGNSTTLSGNSVPASGNSTTKLQGARITKNNKELGDGFRKYQKRRKDLGL